MGLYITSTELESRVSPKKLRSLTDDGNTGTSSDSAVSRAIDDAESEINSACAAVFPIVPFTGTIPPLIKSMALDFAVAFLAQRHPEVMRLDWEKLLKTANDRLDRIRTGKRSVGVSPPDPAANQGVPMVTSLNPDPLIVLQRRFSDDWGDF